MARESEARQLGEPPPGNAAALERLYALHAPALRRRCLRLTHDPSAADDLMQEVFVRFIARFPEPPAAMNVGAYLHATARNVLWKQLRDDHEVPDGEIEDAAGADDDLERDPERATLLVEQRHLVRRCAALLTGRQRRALALRELEGHSYAEIGAELGIGDDAVAQVISRARVRLRGALRRAQIDLDKLPAECRALLAPLSDYVDGRHASTSPEIEAHLATCESCQRTVAAYQEAGSRLRGTGPLAPIGALLARIGEIAHGGDGPLGVGALASMAAAAVLAVGGGGVLLAHHLTEGPSAVRRTPVAPVTGRTTPASTAGIVALAPAPSAGTPAAVSDSAAPPATQLRVRQPADRHGLQPRTHHARPSATSPKTGASAAPVPVATPPPPVVSTPAATATPAATPTPTTPSSPPAQTTTTAPPKTTTPPVTLPHVEKTLTTILAPIRAGITTPQVSVPSVATPVVTTPAVTVPAVAVPQVTTPPITTPIGKIPPVTTPPISTPAVTVPSVTVPAISTPIVKIPPITTPKIP